MARNFVKYLEIEVENIVNLDYLKVPANVKFFRFNNIKNLNYIQAYLPWVK